MIVRPPGIPHLSAVFVASLAVAGGFLQAQESGKKEVSPVPAKFFQVADEPGYFWQAFGNGALTSGETQYLQSGLNLLVGGEAFSPEKAEVTDPLADSDTAAEILLTGKFADVEVRRSLWFDTQRGGVRVLDTFTNRGSSRTVLPVALRTTFPFGWQSLHSPNGDLLSRDPVLSLANEDSGLIVHFSAAEGRHDLLFLVSSEEGGLQPDLTASTNSRELTFSYELDLETGKTVSLVHWVMQRNTGDLRTAADVFAPFVQRGVLIQPRVESGLAKTVANFSPDSIPAESTAPSGLRALLSLNQLTDRIGWHRRGADIHWIGPGNQLSGAVTEGGSVKAGFPGMGEIEIPLSDIAAVRGGGGLGRSSFLYLRNGQVFPTAVDPGIISWTPTEAKEAAPFDWAQGNLLLLATKAGDGKPPAGTSHFVELRDGTVFAIDAKGSDPISSFHPWGMEMVNLEELEELAYFSGDYPGFRLLQKDRSLTEAFFPPMSWKLATASGTEIEVNSSRISRIWRAGAVGFHLVKNPGIWLDFSEVPAFALPASGGLFAVNNVVAGRLGEETITVLSEGSQVEIQASQIRSMSRLFDGDSSGSKFDRFLIKFHNGDELEGGIDLPLLTLRNGDDSVVIPLEHLISYQSEADS